MLFHNFLRKCAATALTTLLACQAAAAFELSPTSPTGSENFNSMWDVSASAPLLATPADWKVERQMDAPRTLGSWDAATDQLMYSGGIALPSNAKNGTWNFGSSTDESDRAVGGLSTTVANGTRCVNVMTKVTNASDTPIDRLTLSYAIEKYREGANVAGYSVQLYTSSDGEAWQSAGEAFLTSFAPDAQTAGADIVPISTVTVENKTMMADIPAGATMYLAWNISVSSGSSPDKAMALAIDDVSVTAGFNSGDAHYIFVENASGAKQLSLYSTSSDHFAPKPGEAPEMSKTINGVTYWGWTLGGTLPTDIHLTDGEAYDTDGFTLSSARDYYLCASPAGISEIDDPDSYTGWVDPDLPPFTPSGIYLRGEVNSWDNLDGWEFSNEGNGVYVLYDKTLNGAFKIADASWSSACNYGSNGTNIVADAPYQLQSGTDSNISCGANLFECKRIVLNITASGEATLLLESNDDPTGLTTVYVIGDFNGWNYMNTSGALNLDETDQLFKGRISMKAGDNGTSRWRIYQRLGMGGVWGAASDGENALSGTLVKGSTMSVATTPATYDVTFDIVTGAYTLTEVESQITGISLSPADVVLMRTMPETVKILSLNNSLIHYNDQNEVFNAIAESMGKDASWTRHTLLGKSLATHWDEGDGLAADGTPGAKMMVRSDAWTHIILQEQSSLPRTNPAAFRESVAKWVGYIREYCPNPNAAIILPVNWAYSSDWENFTAYNKMFIDNYMDVAAEFGLIVCPVANAYQAVYETEGTQGIAPWFSDDRHPTPLSTYMAACMEYGLIYGQDPTEISWHTEGLTDTEAASMRSYASAALKSVTNYVDHINGKIHYKVAMIDDFGLEYAPEGDVAYSVSGGGTVDSDGCFTSDGSAGEFEVTAAVGNFSKSAKIKVADCVTEVESYPAIYMNQDNLTVSEDFDSMGDAADATLPEAWRIDRQTVEPRTIGTYGVALTNTTYSGGINLPSNAKNGIWNFGNGESTDRAVGGITTGVDNGTRAINLYTHLYNDGRKNIEQLTLSYDIEKYRQGSNPAGFAVKLYYSVDGRHWTAAGDDFYTYLAPDAQTAGYAEVPGETTTVEGQLPTGLGRGMDLYLAWNISVASGSAANLAMALAIDNVTLTGQLPEVPVCRHYIYVDDCTGWDSLGLYAYGDSELWGAWPGQAPIDERDINGTIYKVFGLDTETGSYNLIFNNWNNGLQLPDYPIVADRDYYFRIDDQKAVEIDPDSGIADLAADNGFVTMSGNIIHAATTTQFTVWNSCGVRVASAQGLEFDMNTLPQGIYVIKCTAPSESATLKVMRR
ncbi:MAG TPA: hypothetical protein K8V47_04145 [Candidatus Amulumruptor caecigallinarius]|uniref:SGNH hydrolase-type esterase domain-containing protein n=1 Tax=Candidatus Amulumruptor caecigallinarius TaxID=2109911 RepID=A0A921E852_9BACT|nr:hypothetical protein [Candidatus Amulumruptor caecigallinarius]